MKPEQWLLNEVRQWADRAQRDLALAGNQKRVPMIENSFDVGFVASLALREKQIQQNYRPVIAVHKWFARRPGTLFRALLLAEFGTGQLRESFFRAQQFGRLRVADPFMGGGIPVLEANRLGCSVIGFDINPMACWIVREEIQHIDLAAYRAGVDRILASLTAKAGELYLTRCLVCGSGKAPVKYFLWVKIQECEQCGADVDLFPGYLLAENRRHPKNVFVCPCCGELEECIDRKRPGACSRCGCALSSSGPAKGGKIKCPACGAQGPYPKPGAGPPRHRLFALEYHCSACKGSHRGRFFKKPDEADLKRVATAERLLGQMQTGFVPKDRIPSGDETNRLLRWGYERYAEMFNARQLLGLAASCEAISREPDERIRRALGTNLSDLLRYQNMLCRYDTTVLKSLDVFSVHGFPVGLVQCESNILGIPNGLKNTNIGSGGWSNVAEKYIKAKEYCDSPFEVLPGQGSRQRIAMAGEWIGEQRDTKENRTVDLRCEDATEARLAPASLDAVFTDPPYFGNVQYAELMDFCYVWLRRLFPKEPFFRGGASTRNAGELTGNEDMNRGADHFTTGLSSVFRRMGAALKPGAPLVFTFHHNDMEAYHCIAVAMLDAGLVCTAAIPCPAEMGASIHINGTGSSIIDTVFVCRAAGEKYDHAIATTSALVALISEDLKELSTGGVECSPGDARCIGFGRLTQSAVSALQADWDSRMSVLEKLARVRHCMERFGDLSALWAHLSKSSVRQPSFEFVCSDSEKVIL